MGEMWREFVFGCRQFRRSPGLAASVAITIGLGVGANLAVFALLQNAFLPPTPYRNASQLVVIQNTGMYHFGGSLPEGLPSPQMSLPDFDDLRIGQRSLSAVGGFSEGQVVVAGFDRPRAVCRVFVTPGLFKTLGVTPVRGRLFADDEFSASAQPVALVTEGLWRAHFRSTPTIAGTSVRLDDQPFTITGVIPTAVFSLLAQREGLLDGQQFDRCIVTPMAAGRGGTDEAIMAYRRTQRDMPAAQAIGRLGAGQTLATARTDLASLAGRIRQQNRATNGKRGLWVEGLDAWRTAEVWPLLLMLSAAATLAFLVACANAAGLILTESVRREAELGVRQALGAGPSQLLRIVLVRAVLWALPGAVLGFVLATATLALVRWGAAAAPGTEQIASIRPGPLVLGAGLVLTLLAGLGTGGVAAWSLRRHNLVEALREGGPTTSEGRRRHRVTGSLVALQVAAATALAIGATLLVHSLWNVVSADRGFEIDRGFVVQVRLPPSKYPKAADHLDFYRRALSRVRALPGVAFAGVSIAAPLTGSSVMLGGDLVVTTPRGKQTLNRLNGQFVTDGYFEALGMKLQRGRFLSESDLRSNADVAVVDEAFCRAYLKGADPLASTFSFGAAPLTIVGVVHDLRQATRRETETERRIGVPGTAFLLYRSAGRPAAWSYLVVRAADNTAKVAQATVRELLAADAEVCLDEPRTFADLFAQQTAERRRILSLVGGFAAIVLLLTALSLTAALSQFVESHTRDIAIRLALGASKRHIVRLTAGHIGLALAAGLVLGCAGGGVLARALASQLYGVEATSASTMIATAGLLVVLGIVASAMPLARGVRVDPLSWRR